FSLSGAFAIAAILALSFAGCSNNTDKLTPVVESSPLPDPASNLVGRVVRAAKNRVRVVRTNTGWQLERNGSPYFIKGAGGDGSCELLARLGGNSIRTWGAENLEKQLDDAQRNGISVCVGIWLGHEGHGFDWNDAAQIARQTEMVREAVQQYKGHPAVVLWG